MVIHYFNLKEKLFVLNVSLIVELVLKVNHIIVYNVDKDYILIVKMYVKDVLQIVLVVVQVDVINAYQDII